MAFEDYQRAEGVSNSMLKEISLPRFPAHFHARFIAKTIEDEDEEPNNGKMDARTFGRLFHRAILETETLTNAFYVKPDGMSFATKEGKAWKVEHQDRVIISDANSKKLVGMARSVWKHPEARALLYGAQTERNLFAEDADGTIRKGRLDIVPSWGPYIADPKSIATLEEIKMSRAIFERRYFVQGAYYIDLAKLCGIEKTKFALIFVEKSAPYVVTVRKLSDQELDWGRDVYKADLASLRHCLETNAWPGDPNDGGEIYMPVFARQQFEKSHE